MDKLAQQLELSTDITQWTKADWFRYQMQYDINSRKNRLSKAMQQLAERLTRCATRLEETELLPAAEGREANYFPLNSLGEIQGAALDIDREIAVLDSLFKQQKEFTNLKHLVFKKR